MKYIFITGNHVPIYFDHPNGTQICMPLGTSMDVQKEQFNETWTSVQCENTLIVFSSRGYMYMMLVSDEKETEQYLKFQSIFIFDLFQLHYGPNVFTDKGYQFQFSKHRVFLSSLLNTQKSLFLNKQCFLVNAIERLEVAEEMKLQAIQVIKKSLSSNAYPMIKNVVIFVGTKLLLNYGKPKVAEPLPTIDLLLLLTYTRSHFQPKTSQLPSEDIPIADYTDHTDIPQNFSDESQIDESSMPIGSLIEPTSLEMMSPQRANLFDSSMLASDIEDTVEDIPLPGSESRSDQKSDSEEENSDEYHSDGSDSSAKNPLSIEPLHRQVFLRNSKGLISPSWLHAYELEFPIKLLILTNQTGSEVDERQKELLNRFSKVISRSLSGFLQYFITVHQTHLVPTLMSHIHSFPGLVHYIFVDRTHQRVIAPSITALCGNMLECDPKVRKMIKKKVWDMVLHAHQALADGYHSMIINSGDFQYSYNLWFEDDDNEMVNMADKSLYKNLNQDEIFKKKKAVINSAFYRDMSARLFPANYKKMKCYELYALYLDGVSAKTIVSHNKSLVDQFRSQNHR